MGGRRSAQGRARSNAAAAPRTPASSKRRPTICSPIGSPSLVNPHGTDAAGCPVRLNGYVNGIHAYGSTRLPAISVGLSSPIGNGRPPGAGGLTRGTGSENPPRGGPPPGPPDHHPTDPAGRAPRLAALIP